METKTFTATHRATGETVTVIKTKRPLGVRYIVFWKDDPEPTVYLASEFTEKFEYLTVIL